MTEFVSVYIAISTQAEAEHIASILVEEKLAACVNTLPGARSVYRWQGRIESAAETVMIAKSRADLFPKLERRVIDLSSYDCPCIVAWPIAAGHGPYLEWLAKETEKQ